MAAAAEAEAAEAELSQYHARGTGLSNEKKQEVKPSSKKSPVRNAKAEDRSPAAATVSRRETAYVVQVGSYKMKDNAERVHAKIKAEGLPVTIKSKTAPSGDEMYLVRFEPTPSQKEAESFKSKAKEIVGADAAILNR